MVMNPLYLFDDFGKINVNDVRKWKVNGNVFDEFLFVPLMGAIN